MDRKAKVIVFVNRPDGELSDASFEFREEELLKLENDQILVKAEHFAINAGLRAYLNFLPLGSNVLGHQVAKYKNLILTRNKLL